MITVKLGFTKSANNVINKSIKYNFTYECTLKDTTSIISPIIIISTSDNISTCNYAEITNFSRKYFIKNIKSIRNNVWQLELSVDVLETYKSEYMNQDVIISKSSNKWNLLLNDGSLQVYQNNIIGHKNFPSGFSAPTPILTSLGFK